MLRKTSLTIGIGLSLCALMTLPASAEETMIVSSPTKTDAQINIDVAYCGNYARRYSDVGERKAQYAACLRSRGDVVTNPQEQTQTPRETKTAETTPTRTYPRLDSLVVSADNSDATYMVMKPDGSRCVSAWSKLAKQRVCKEPVTTEELSSHLTTSTTPLPNSAQAIQKIQDLGDFRRRANQAFQPIDAFSLCRTAVVGYKFANDGYEACMKLFQDPYSNPTDKKIMEAVWSVDPEVVAKRNQEKEFADKQAAAERTRLEEEDKAALLEYTKALEPFQNTFKVRKDIGDAVCEKDGTRGEVEKVYKDKIQVRYYGGHSSITTYDSNDHPEFNSVRNPDTLSWIPYNTVGLCDKYIEPPKSKVMMNAAQKQYEQILNFLGHKPSN